MSARTQHKARNSTQRRKLATRHYGAQRRAQRSEGFSLKMLFQSVREFFNDKKQLMKETRSMRRTQGI
jgi:hypothetical protein